MLAARFHFPSRLLHFLAAGVLFGLGAACSGIPPEKQALAYRPDFSSPEAAGRSFLVAWSEGRTITEYHALSEAWKSEVGGTLDAYILARPQLQAEVGWTGGQAWRLEPVGRQATRDGVVIWWGLAPEAEPLLGLEMVAQNYLEFEEAGEQQRRPGAYFDAPLSDFYGFDGATLWVEIDDSSVRMASRLEGIRSIQLGTEWKIRGLLAWEPPAES
jgi:hypothetical protein